MASRHEPAPSFSFRRGEVEAQGNLALQGLHLHVLENALCRFVLHPPPCVQHVFLVASRPQLARVARLGLRTPCATMPLTAVDFALGVPFPDGSH